MSTPSVQCRTCLQHHLQYHDLGEFLENSVQILEMLDAIVPQINIKIKIPTNFPHTICLECADRLLKSYKFQQMSINTNKRLVALLQGNADKQSSSAWMVNLEEVLDPLKGIENIDMKEEVDNEKVNFECESKVNCAKQYEMDEQGVNGVNMDSQTSLGNCSPIEDVTFVDTERKKRFKKTRRTVKFNCVECGETFQRLNNFKKHAIMHNSNNVQFCCDICQYKIEEPSLYIAHLQTHKNDTFDEKESEAFACALCKKLFRHPIALIKHTEMHTSKKITKKKRKIKLVNNEINKTCVKEDKNTAVKQEVLTQDIDITDSHPINDDDYCTEEAERENPYNNKTGHYPCEVCSKVFDRPYRVKRHSSVHSFERRHACALCTYRFPTANLLKTHMIQHENETHEKSLTQTPAGGLKCSDCSRLFETHALLTAHRQIHAHTAPEANFSCTECQCQFVSEKFLIEHITTRHPEMQKHICQQCDKIFVLAEHLTAHVNRHRDNKEPLMCLICDKEFSYKNTLREHMRTHKNDSSFLCPQCGKTFKTSSNLSQHMKRHIGLKQYSCPECPSRFNCRSDLIKHMSTHRKGKPHECDVCKSRFTRAYSLRKHKALHTGEKRYKCTECVSAFATNDHLRRHMRTHTGEKPYKCKYCDRTYAESGDLTKHIRKHIGQNTYICDQCPMSFKYNAELRQHVSEHFTKAQMQKMSIEAKEGKELSRPYLLHNSF